MSGRRFVPLEHVALIYAGFGEKEQAIAWMKRAVAERSTNPFFTPDPRYDNLRSDARFQDLMRQMGLTNTG